MVSKASEDLPLPERPVTTTMTSRGSETVMFFRLCSRAPWTTIWLSAIFRSPLQSSSLGKYTAPAREAKESFQRVQEFYHPPGAPVPFSFASRPVSYILKERTCWLWVTSKRTGYDPQGVLADTGGGARRPPPGSGRHRPARARPGGRGIDEGLARPGRGRHHVPGEARRRVPANRQRDRLPGRRVAHRGRAALRAWGDRGGTRYRIVYRLPGGASAQVALHLLRG